MRRALLLVAVATAAACSGEDALPPAPPAPEVLVLDGASEAPAPSAEERFPELAALVVRAKRAGADLARADRELEALEEDGKHIDEYLEARGTPLPEMDADDLAERGAAVVPELLLLLDLPGDWIRDVVYETLAILGPEAASAVPTLVGILHDRGDPDRLLAADALFRIAPDTPGLTAPVVAWTGVPLDAMQEAWPDLEERLIAVLLAGDPEAKVGAARTAAQMEHPSRELLSALGRALAAGTPDAALALEKEGRGDTATLHALVALLESDRSGVSRAAKKLLEKSRADLAPVAFDLARVAAEGDDSAAATAAEFLPAAGDESVVVPVLLDMLRSDRASRARAAAARALTTWPDLETRLRAKLALCPGGEPAARLGEDLATAALQRELWAFALEALDEHPEEVPRAVSVILEALREGDVASPRHAVGVLGHFGPEAVGALPALERLSGSSDEELARFAREAIRRIRRD